MADPSVAMCGFLWLCVADPSEGYVWQILLKAMCGYGCLTKTPSPSLSPDFSAGILYRIYGSPSVGKDTVPLN